MSIASSPCTGVCTLDEATALCLGCGRNIDEIVGWGAFAEPRRLAIMAELPGRLAGDLAPARDAGLPAVRRSGPLGADRWTGAS